MLWPVLMVNSSSAAEAPSLLMPAPQSGGGAGEDLQVAKDGEASKESKPTGTHGEDMQRPKCPSNKVLHLIHAFYPNQDKVNVKQCHLNCDVPVCCSKMNERTNESEQSRTRKKLPLV